MTDIDGPPADWDNAPPPAVQGGGQARGGSPSRYAPRGALAPAQVAAEAAAFLDWLADRQTRSDLGRVLPSHIGIDVFLDTAKTAVTTNSQLLAPELRGSLLAAIAVAARLGLRPDNREGVLIPRWDDQAKALRVTFLTMKGGLEKLGRLTGALKYIRPVIVFQGEAVAIDEANGKIRHTRGPDEISIVAEAYRVLQGAPDETGRARPDPAGFFSRVQLAYCIIVAADGSETMHWMPAARIALIRDASKAKYGPWWGPFVDRMIIKTVIRAACQAIDLDISNPATAAFREALDADLEANFEHVEPPRQPALPPPVSKLDALDTAASKTKLPPPTPVVDPPADLEARTQDAIDRIKAMTAAQLQKLGDIPAFKALIADLMDADRTDLADKIEDARAAAKSKHEQEAVDV